MIDGIPLAVFDGLGVVAVVALVGWLVWSGRLIPKATHDAQVQSLNDRIDDEQHEKGEWRTEARLKDQTVAELNQQNQAMLNAFGPTLTEFLQSLRRAGVGAREDGGDG